MLEGSCSRVIHDYVYNLIELLRHCYSAVLHIIHELLQITHDLIFEALQVLQLGIDSIKAARASSWAALTLFEIRFAQRSLFLCLPLCLPVRGCHFSR